RSAGRRHHPRPPLQGQGRAGRTPADPRIAVRQDRRQGGGPPAARGHAGSGHATAGRPAAPIVMDGSTIYALGTPTPSRAHPGAFWAIRRRGPRAADALIFVTEPRAFERGHSARDPSLPPPRRMALRTLIDPLSGETIDRGLAVWFEAPNSETGETMA